MTLSMGNLLVLLLIVYLLGLLTTPFLILTVLKSPIQFENNEPNHSLYAGEG